MLTAAHCRAPRAGIMHLAEFNRGVLRYDWDDARVADFAQNIQKVNALAMRAPGFIWMLDEPGMDAAQRDPDGHLGGDLRLASTLSVWQSPQALQDFVFKTVHRVFMDRGPEWFDPGQGLRLVMWWVPEGHRPTIAEAVERFNRLSQDGASEAAFDWAWLRRGH